MHIIVVDDEVITLRILERRLSRDLPTARITTVSRAVEALVVLQEQGADLLITDHMMPGMTGLELIREVRRCGYVLPILLFSGAAGLEGAIQAGATRLLQKPLSLSAVMAVIVELLER